MPRTKRIAHPQGARKPTPGGRETRFVLPTRRLLPNGWVRYGHFTPVECSRCRELVPDQEGYIEVHYLRLPGEEHACYCETCWIEMREERKRR